MIDLAQTLIIFCLHLWNSLLTGLPEASLGQLNLFFIIIRADLSKMQIQPLFLSLNHFHWLLFSTGQNSNFSKTCKNTHWCPVSCLSLQTYLRTCVHHNFAHYISYKRLDYTGVTTNLKILVYHNIKVYISLTQYANSRLVRNSVSCPLTLEPPSGESLTGHHNRGKNNMEKITNQKKL